MLLIITDKQHDYLPLLTTLTLRTGEVACLGLAGASLVRDSPLRGGVTHKAGTTRIVTRDDYAALSRMQETGLITTLWTWREIKLNYKRRIPSPKILGSAPRCLLTSILLSTCSSSKLTPLRYRAIQHPQPMILSISPRRQSNGWTIASSRRPLLPFLLAYLIISRFE